MLGRLFHLAFRDKDPTTREVARSQLIGIYGSAFAIAGIKGLPLYGAVEMLANYLMGDDDEPYDFDYYISQKFNETGHKGLLNKMIGVDVASRTGFNGLIWREDPKRVREVGMFLYTLEQAMGPSYGAFLNAQRGYELFKEGEYQRSIEAITPSFIRNGFKAMRMAEEGVRNKDGTPVVEDISKYNIMMQVVGFTPTEVSEARERAGARKGVEDKILARRKTLINQYVSAFRERDKKAMRETWEKILEFNGKNPQRGFRIEQSTIYDSIIGRRRRQLQSVDGLYTNPNYMQRVKELAGQK